MKKLTCILLSLLLALALSSCDVAEVLGSLGDLVNEAMSNAQESADTGEESAAPDVNTETAVYPEIPDSEEPITDETFSETYTEEVTEEVTEAPTDALSIVIGTPDSHPQLAELFPEDITWLTTLEEEDGRHWGDDGFAVRQKDGKIYIFGANAVGSLNGVYDFIEDNMGVLWIKTTEDGIIYDAMPTLTATKGGLQRKISLLHVRTKRSYGSAQQDLSVP